MRCPSCQKDDSKVIDSRLSDGGSAVRRRRHCQICQHRFTTFERFEFGQPNVIKSDGRRESWDEEKLRRGLFRALEKRPVETEHVEKIINDISREMLLTGEREISSTMIGTAVMTSLKGTDEVAYVRYASVYRSFEDVAAFNIEIESLKKEKNKKTNITQLSLLTGARKSNNEK